MQLHKYYNIKREDEHIGTKICKKEEERCQVTKKLKKSQRSTLNNPS